MERLITSVKLVFTQWLVKGQGFWSKNAPTWTAGEQFIQISRYLAMLNKANWKWFAVELAADVWNVCASPVLLSDITILIYIITGGIYDLTGSFQALFRVSALFSFISGVIVVLIILMKRNWRKLTSLKNKQKTSNILTINSIVFHKLWKCQFCSLERLSLLSKILIPCYLLHKNCIFYSIFF